jgi:phosphoribosyl-ATP pyrophosphohydrolase/phosphoribosyl-AMP cyclohydrolase
MDELLLNKLKFDEHGLIPALVQDDRTNEVLMLAWMNAESLKQTLATGETWFWSRARRELWHKGATSGHTQRVVDLRYDCDADALLLRVLPAGPACHTGARSCFFRSATEEQRLIVEGKIALEQPQAPVTLANVAALDMGLLLQDLFQLIHERKEKRPEGSYTTYLFNSGLDKILKKVGEESAETIIAAKNGNSDEARKHLAAEISDLLYHLLVLMAERHMSLRDIVNELRNRAAKPALAKYNK